MSDKPTDDGPVVDPEEFLAALLRISPEDAATAREKAAESMEQEDRRTEEEADK